MRVAAIAGFASLAACSPMRVVEDTPDSVSIRYDGVAVSLEDATTEATRLCGTHDRVARLRNIETKAAFERFAHFTCVSE